MTKYRFFYRPSGLIAIIIWSWTAIFFCGGVIFQYEMARFNWPAIVIAVLFIAFLTWQLCGRQVIVTGESFRVSRLLAPRELVINVHQLEQVRFDAHTLRFRVGAKRYDLRMSSKAIKRLKTLITD